MFFNVIWDLWVQEIETSSSDQPKKGNKCPTRSTQDASDNLHKFNKFCRLVLATVRATPLRKKLEEKFKTHNKYHCMINEIEPAS